MTDAFIAGVVVRDLVAHGDRRGRFVETFRQSWLPDGARSMVQGNRSEKQAEAVVGLHFHRRQSDWWHVIEGRALAVVHDLRVGSPTEGVTMHVPLEGDEPRGLYVPPGVGHGFAAHTDVVLTYLVDGYYDPDDELGVRWDDGDVAADWGVAEPVLSDRDLILPTRRALAMPPRWSGDPVGVVG